MLSSPDSLSASSEDAKAARSLSFTHNLLFRYSRYRDDGMLFVTVTQPIPTEETEIRAALAAADYEAATTLTIRVYGPELLAFLRSRLRELHYARDAFAWLAEDLWRGMPNFRGESSVRTWAYAIARNVIRRYLDRELRVRMQAVPISQVSRASALAVALPSQSGIDDRVARIRAQLDDEEQMLLALRVDKAMDWKDVAQVMLYEGVLSSEDDIKREAARLRKRFQILKDKLRRLAAESA